MTSNNTKIDFLAREPHHREHAMAIYDKLPEAYKGEFYTDAKSMIKPLNKYVTVFSYGDLKQTQLTRKKAIFCEHGAGMFYAGTSHPSYAGSIIGRKNVALRLSPNKTHADKERETLKGIPVEIIGVPKMDRWVQMRNETEAKWDPDRRPVVAISFHWDCKVCPETRSAFKEYAHILDQLSAKFDVLGHGHPRIIDTIARIYDVHDIEVVRDFNEVLERADIYVCDNSSTIFEFAFTRKPVALINAKPYRKRITHPGNPRFWKHAGMGPQINSPSELLWKIDEAWKDYKKYLPLIDAAVDDVFTFTDGKCADRAVAAMIQFIDND